MWHLRGAQANTLHQLERTTKSGINTAKAAINKTHCGWVWLKRRKHRWTGNQEQYKTINYKFHFRLLCPSARAFLPIWIFWNICCAKTCLLHFARNSITLSFHRLLGWGKHVKTKLVAPVCNSCEHEFKLMAKTKYCNFKFIDISICAISVNHNCNRNHIRIAETTQFSFQFNFQHAKIGHACQNFIYKLNSRWVTVSARLASVEQKSTTEIAATSAKMHKPRPTHQLGI